MASQVVGGGRTDAFRGIWVEALVAVAISIVYALLTYKVSQVLTSMDVGDIVTHARYIHDVGPRSAITDFAYPGWHIMVWIAGQMSSDDSLIRSACIMNALFGGLAALAVFFVVRSIVVPVHAPLPLVALITVILLLVCSIHIPGTALTPYRYAGSPTIWHNPTYIAVRPFAVISCFLLYRMLKEHRADGKLCVGYGATTVIALFLKPSYAQVQIPALFIILLIHLIRRHDWKFVGKIALSVVPALCVMGLQFYSLMYSSSGGGGGIGFGLFHLLIESGKPVVIPLLLLLAFPLYALVVLRKDLFDGLSPYAYFVAMLFVGFVEANCIYEMGPRMHDGNFAWGYYLAIFLFWVFVLPLFVRRVRSKELKGAAAVIGCVLILLQFASGVFYAIQLLFGTSLY